MVAGEASKIIQTSELINRKDHIFYRREAPHALAPAAEARSSRTNGTSNTSQIRNRVFTAMGLRASRRVSSAARPRRPAHAKWDWSTIGHVPQLIGKLIFGGSQIFWTVLVELHASDGRQFRTRPGPRGGHVLDRAV